LESVDVLGIKEFERVIYVLQIFT